MAPMYLQVLAVIEMAAFALGELWMLWLAGIVLIRSVRLCARFRRAAR